MANFLAQNLPYLAQSCFLPFVHYLRMKRKNGCAIFRITRNKFSAFLRKIICDKRKERHFAQALHPYVKTKLQPTNQIKSNQIIKTGKSSNFPSTK